MMDDGIALTVRKYPEPHSGLPRAVSPSFSSRVETIGVNSHLSRAATVLIPMMASRLMLSLKKTAMEPAAVWSPPNSNMGMSMEHRSMRFASGVPGGADGAFGRSIPPSLVEDGLGLELISQSSRKYSY